MTVRVFIAHAKNEEGLAEKLAAPIRAAGYDVAHEGTLLVGESIVGQATQFLRAGGPLIVCGTTASMGTRWTRKLAEAARSISGVRIFVVQMDEDADVEAISLDEVVANYWKDPIGSEEKLLDAVRKNYPLDKAAGSIRDCDLEARYREIALKSCDIIDLANLPEDDRHLASKELELRRLYVALRMRIEVASGEKAEDASLEEVENRRLHSEWVDGLGEENVISLGERLSHVKRMVILGDPGAGKSTLLRWLATAYLLKAQAAVDWREMPDVELLPDESWLPILVRCRDLPASSLTLDEILLHSLKKSEIPESECKALTTLLRGKLSEGSAILLVDGLDEITDPSARACFAEQLTRINRAIPKAPVVITSRIVGYREMGYRIRSGFEHLTVADLSRSDKDEFARRWCALTERVGSAEAAESLISDIHSSDRIERLTGNPMLLTTMALIKRKIGRLPQRRVDLYEKAVEVLLNWRSAIDAALDPREALPQLEYIAYAMCDEGVQQIREDQAIELLQRVRDEFPHVHPLREHSPEEFLALLERRTGLIMQTGFVRHKGREVPVYEFRHLTLQEYLAGIAIVQGHYRGRGKTSSQVDVIRPLAGRVRQLDGGPVDSRFDEFAVIENWREPLRLCIAASNDDVVDESMLAILRNTSEEGRQSRRARTILASLCLADEPNVSSEVVDEILGAYVRLLNEDYSASDSVGILNDTALSVAKSRWGAKFCEFLLDGFFGSKDAVRYACGGVYSLAQDECMPENKELRVKEFEARRAVLKRCSDREFAGIALHISEIAYSKSIEIPRVGGLATCLVSRLSSNVALDFAISWALGWLRLHAKWKPNKKNISTIVSTLKGERCEGETVFWLARVLHGVGGRDVAAVLASYVERSSDKVKSALMPSLASMAGEEYLYVYKKYYLSKKQSLWHASVNAVAYCCESKLDRHLVHQLTTYQGKRFMISNTLLERVSKEKEISVSEVEDRYLWVAEKFGLPLKFSKN